MSMRWIVVTMLVVGLLVSAGCSADIGDSQSFAQESTGGFQVKLTASPLSKEGGSSTAFYPPRPRSIAELVRRSDVIVVGTVRSVVREETREPYVVGDAQRGTNAPLLPQKTYTYYRIDVEEIILDDGTLAGDKSLIMGMRGEAADIGKAQTETTRQFPMPRPGERYVLFLTSDPATGHATYGSGAWGRIHIDSEIARFPDWERTPVDILEDNSRQAFIQAVKEAVQAGLTPNSS